MRELDSRHVDTDSGRFVLSLLWEEKRNLLYLVADTEAGEEAARIRVPADEAAYALRHPMVYLRGHL